MDILVKMDRFQIKQNVLTEFEIYYSIPDTLKFVALIFTSYTYFQTPLFWLVN